MGGQEKARGTDRRPRGAQKGQGKGWHAGEEGLRRPRARARRPRGAQKDQGKG